MDLCLFADDKATLRAWHASLTRELAGRRLVLKPAKSRIHRCDEGVEFLGFRVLPTHRRLSPSTARRAHRRLRRLYARLRRRTLEALEVRQRQASRLGHARWGNTRGLVLATAAAAGGHDGPGAPSGVGLG